MNRNELLNGMDIRHALFGMFFAFNNRLQAVGDTFYEEMTCKQFFLLICLSLFQTDAPTIKELAEVMGSSHQNVKKILDKLEKHNFVRIVQDEKDKRKIRVVQTEKMALLSKKYETKQREFFSKFYDGVSEEDIFGTFRMLNQLESNLIAIKEEN